MSMLTSQGFKRKRYIDIFISLENRSKEQFGEKINTSQRSFLGILLRIVAWILSLFAQDLENTYNSNFVDTSEGVALDRNAKRQGAERRSATRAIGRLRVKGEPNRQVENGFIGETVSGIQFGTTSSARIGSSGFVEVPIEAVDSGEIGNVQIGQITEIVNPQVGIEEIVNLGPTTGGRNRETDEELKRRLDRTNKEDNQIVYNLLNLDGVRDVFLDSNDAMVEVEGIPPKSIAPFVIGGNDEEIARTIMLYKGGGIQSFGSTVINITDTKRREQRIGFTRPIEVPIYVRAKLSTNDDYIENNDAVTKIIEYIGGSDQNGTEYDGLGIGKAVIAFKGAVALGSLPGVEDVELELSIDDATYTSGNIPINKNQRPITDWQKVVIL